MSIHSNIKKKITVKSVQKYKNRDKLVMITAYDALFASLFEESVDMILVGDSLNMSFFGKGDTLSATMDQMIYHTQAVCNGAQSPLIVLDMPFGTYNSKEEALSNALRVYKETCADAIKIEGGKERAQIIEHLTKHGIAVVAHIGLMPQFVRSEGGYRVRGKSREDIETLIEDAKALESAGAFIVLIEGVVSSAAKEISSAISVPTIGIGAGDGCDGQVLVWSDMLGFFENFKPKFVKQYLQGATLVKDAVKEYTNEVKSGKFPTDEFSY